MNKDMINIDDFVREKLGGREEKEDPAAWLRMKDLLDKEMPERAVPVGFRFGRPLAFLGCALLATIIGAGGYHLLTREQAAPDNNPARPATTHTSDSDKTGRTSANQENNSSQATTREANTVTTNENTSGKESVASIQQQGNNAQSPAKLQATTSTGQQATAQQQSTAATMASRNGDSKGHQTNAAPIQNYSAPNTHHQPATTPLQANNAGTTNNNLAGNNMSSGKTVASQAAHNNKANPAAHKTPGAAAPGKQQATPTAPVTANTPAANNTATRVAAATDAKAGKQNGTVTASGNGGTAKPAVATNNNNTATQPARTGTASTAAAKPGTEQNKEQNGTAANTTAQDRNPIAGNNGNHTAAVTTGNASANSVQKDSIPVIEIVNRTQVPKTPSRTPIYTSDTASLGKTGMDSGTAAAAKDNNATGGQDATIAANNAVTATAATGKVKKSTLRKIAAANKKAAAQQTAGTGTPAASTASTTADTNPSAATTASKTTGSSSTAVQSAATADKKKKKSGALGFMRNIHWDEVKENVKYDIGHAKFNMGIAAGANYSISKDNSFTGFQLGATGELVFNKHLSLMAELKYFNRSGARKMVDDSYIKESARPDSTNSAGNWFTVFTDSSNRYFNFSTLHSFEVPVTLRYAIRKFYLMTGINVGYYLGVNVEEVNNKYTLAPRSININAAQPMLKNTKELDIHDFDSRVAIGYIFGAGYQISPSVQIDLRLVNSFWDNAGSDGAKRLSKDFYKIPSVQVTLGYRFGQGDKTMRGFGPNSQP